MFPSHQCIHSRITSLMGLVVTSYPLRPVVMDSGSHNDFHRAKGKVREGAGERPTTRNSEILQNLQNHQRNKMTEVLILDNKEKVPK